MVAAAIVVEADAWIAADVFIGPGVTVGAGAVVGARSTVVKDIASWTVVAGTPPRVLKQRPRKNS
jgi:putative colanic acid biosynthesis acetyltransferase WcaF